MEFIIFVILPRYKIKLPNWICVRLEGKLLRSFHSGNSLNFWSTSLGIFIVLTYPARAVDSTMKTKTTQNRITYLFISFPFGTFIFKNINNKRHMDANESGLNIRILSPINVNWTIMLIAIIMTLYLIMYLGGFGRGDRLSTVGVLHHSIQFACLINIHELFIDSFIHYQYSNQYSNKYSK